MEAKENFENLQNKCKSVLFELNMKESELRTLKGKHSEIEDYNQVKNQLHFTLEEYEALKFEIKKLEKKTKEISPLKNENKELSDKIERLEIIKQEQAGKLESKSMLFREQEVLAPIFIDFKKKIEEIPETPKKPISSQNEELLSNQLNQISDLVNKLECTLKKEKKVEFRELTFEEILQKLQDFEKKYQILIQESSSIIREQEEQRLILNEENDRLGIICRERLQQLQDQMYDRGKVLIKLAVAYAEVDRLSSNKESKDKEVTTTKNAP